MDIIFLELGSADERYKGATMPGNRIDREHELRIAAPRATLWGFRRASKRRSKASSQRLQRQHLLAFASTVPSEGRLPIGDSDELFSWQT